MARQKGNPTSSWGETPDRREQLREWARQRREELRWCRCIRPLFRRYYLQRGWCLRCGRLEPNTVTRPKRR